MKRALIILIAAVALLIPATTGAQTTTLSPQMQRVWDDVSRLQAILIDVGSGHDFSAATWRVVANEANTLANRTVGRTSGWRNESRSAATQLRHHVREMRAAALRGDAAGARTHAAEALPFANTLKDRMSR